MKKAKFTLGCNTLACKGKDKDIVKEITLPDEMGKVAEELRKWSCPRCGAWGGNLYIIKVETIE